MIKKIYSESLQTPIIISRRKGTRSIRLSIKTDGSIRLSVPFGISEGRALRFLEDKKDWISKHLKQPTLLRNNDHIGKSHRLIFMETRNSTIRTRIKANLIIINIPHDLSYSDNDVQIAARKAAERALKKESENLLPQRLEVLADKHNVAFRSVKVKKLKSGWGSCDNQQNIVLNIYLIQLNWSLIDYVILHELAHTKFQHHQQDFWAYVNGLLPDWKLRRKELKSMPTDILVTNF